MFNDLLFPGSTGIAQRDRLTLPDRSKRTPLQRHDFPGATRPEGSVF